MTPRILVIENDPDIMELIGVNLLRAGYSVFQAGDIETARHQLDHTLPDLILLERILPGTGDIEWIRGLRGDERIRNVPVIIVSDDHNEDDMLSSLEAGADDYITKPFSPRELLLRIAMVLRRFEPHRTEHAIEVAGLQLDPASRRVLFREQQSKLGPVEFRLLHFLMTHAECAFNRSQLREQVWEKHECIADRTIDVNIHRLRTALGKIGHSEKIQSVRGNGYIFSSKSPY